MQVGIWSISRVQMHALPGKLKPNMVFNVPWDETTNRVGMGGGSHSVPPTPKMYW